MRMMLGNRNDDRFLPGGGGGRKGGGANGTVNVFGLRIRKKSAIALTGMVGAVGMLGPDLSISSIRRVLEETYATPCVKNVYVASIEDAMMMPPIPAREDDYVPTHIQLCYEWLRRDALNVDELTAPKEYIIEHRDVCLDWSAPHFAMMEIFSSTIIQAMTRRWRYVHYCHSHRAHDETRRGYDWTPFQTVFSEAAMGPNADLIDPELFKEQCKACLMTYNSQSDEERVRAKSLHHCFAFPADSTLYPADVSLTPKTEPYLVPLPSQPDPARNIAPLSSVVAPVRARLNHAAQEWTNVTDAPPLEQVSGTVILVDPNTKGVNPNVLLPYIPADTTSITVMSSPLCYTTHLSTGQLCKDYVDQLVAAYTPQFPSAVGGGFEGGPGVKAEFPASTAALMSRAILAKDLVCPVSDTACLLPAMGKKPPTKATLADGICSPPCPGAGEGPTKFFDKVGTNDVVDVIQLPDNDIPPNTEGTPSHPDPVELPPSPDGFTPSDAFPDNQQPTTVDGYPTGGLPPPPYLDPQTVKDTPSLDAYKGVEPKLPAPVQAASTGDPNEESPIVNTPNVQPADSDTEKPVTPAQVDQAVANEEPIMTNTNTYDPETGEEVTTDPATQFELESEENNDLIQRDLTDEAFEEAAQKREESTRRVVKGAPLAHHYEVPCPTVSAGGSTVSTDDGITLTAEPNGDTLVSDPKGSVAFDGNVLIDTVEPVQGEVVRPDGTTETTDVIEVENTRTNETLVIPVSGSTQTNPDGTMETSGTPLGSLTVDSTTGECMLITEGKSRGNQGQGKGNTNSKAKTVITGTCKTTGNENFPETDEGTSTMGTDGGLEVTQQTETLPEHGFLDTDPADGHNTGAYQINAAPTGVAGLSVSNPDSCKRNDAAVTEKSGPVPNAIEILDVDVGNNEVTFNTYQTYKDASISWVAVAVKDPVCSVATADGGDLVPHCIKVNEVDPDNTFTAPRPFQDNCQEGGVGSYGTTYPGRKVKCDAGGTATIDVFIHDGSKNIGQMLGPPQTFADMDASIAGAGLDWITKYMDYMHPTCDASQDLNNKCWYRYTIDCAAAAAGLAARRRRLTGIGGMLRGLVPKNVVPAAPAVGDRILFARNIVEKCPELARGRVFNNFEFGLTAKSAQVGFNQEMNGAAAMQ